MAEIIENIGGYTLRNLNRINVLLGKNGCGKSTLLRNLDSAFQNKAGWKGKYVTPERGGVLNYEAGIEQNISNNTNWLPSTRRRNQSENFKQQTVAQFRNLELKVLREISNEKRDDKTYTFYAFIERINKLLDNIYIKQEEVAFKIYRKGENTLLNHEQISSGESESISLAIECLSFIKDIKAEFENNFLFLDEPDVHLHPDLQTKFMNFLLELANETPNFQIVLSTHSTAILGSLSESHLTNIAFMKAGDKDISFEGISHHYKKILPMFGAHPLSEVFNSRPVFLVEGEDDERIWQQAIRSSEGKIKIYPCSTDTISAMNEYEIEVQRIIRSIYDSAKGFSLRDSDGINESINDLENIIRFRLSCRNAENLILTNEVLSLLGISWDIMKERMEAWINDKANENRLDFKIMQNFKAGGYNRKSFDLKKLRNLLMSFGESEKPWEVAVGQVIGRLTWSDGTNFNSEGSMVNYLGEKLTKAILIKDKIKQI